MRVPARALFSPSAFFGGVGFCCGAPPGAPAFCFPTVWGACFLGVAPGGTAGVTGGCSAFFSRGVLSGIVAPCGCLRSRFAVRRFEGVSRGWCACWVVCGVKVREARVQGRFTLVSGLRGVARFLRRCYFVAMAVASPVGCGAHVLAGWTVRVVFAYAFPCE